MKYKMGCAHSAQFLNDSFMELGTQSLIHKLTQEHWAAVHKAPGVDYLRFLLSEAQGHAAAQPNLRCDRCCSYIDAASVSIPTRLVYASLETFGQTSSSLFGQEIIVSDSIHCWNKPSVMQRNFSHSLSPQWM